MVICRTPLRISFFGGGTDYPIWYNDHGGAVISATINKYSYITARWLPPYFDYKHRIRYFDQEQVKTLDEIKHPSVRECARYLEVRKGLEVVHNADVPARSGLGSSSTFTVGMLHTLHTLQGRMPTKRQLAVEAIHVEQNMIGESVGSQDQTAAAFGGLNLIRFNKSSAIEVDPIVLAEERSQRLQENLLLVFTGFSRTASDIARLQIAATPEKCAELNAMTELCQRAVAYLTDTKDSLDSFGEMLNEQWSIKKSLTGKISNREVNEIYDIGIRNGALGGKLLGAGGGGFMLFYAPRSRHENIKSALRNKLFIPVRFDYTGSKIIYYART
jgi:D-glycero-alpha-D-manno-heptose-7-phosphate kinase